MPNRKAIFDLMRNSKGAGFTQGQVDGLNYAMDQAGIPKDGETGFDAALQIILKHEGGFVNHPKDPGGMTNLGVTRKTYGAWIGRNPSEAEMRALKPADVATIYRKNYWDVLKCDDLNPGLALVAFDHGVNAGPGRSAKIIQKLSGVSQDGVVGPNTVAAAAKWVASIGADEAIRKFSDERDSYYKSLSTFGTFGNGWLRRVDETEKAALAIA